LVENFQKIFFGTSKSETGFKGITWDNYSQVGIFNNGGINLLGREEGF